MSTSVRTTEISREFVEQARKFLRDDYLPKIERCLERLTDEQVWWRANEESNSIGNLLLHLSGNARQWIVDELGRKGGVRNRQAEFDQRQIISRSELLALIKGTLQEVDSVLANFAADRLLDRYLIQGCDVTALEAIFHVTEHFSMHTGQIILLTKMLNTADLQFYEFPDGVPIQKWRQSENQ